MEGLAIERAGLIALAASAAVVNRHHMPLSATLKASMEAMDQVYELAADQLKRRGPQEIEMRDTFAEIALLAIEAKAQLAAFWAAHPEIA